MPYKPNPEARGVSRKADREGGSTALRNGDLPQAIASRPPTRPCFVSGSGKSTAATYDGGMSRPVDARVQRALNDRVGCFDRARWRMS